MGGPEFIKSRGWAFFCIQRRPLIQGWKKQDCIAYSVLDALFIELAYVKGMIEGLEDKIDDIKFSKKELPWYSEPRSGMMLSCFMLEEYFIKYHHVWEEERTQNARTKRTTDKR